MQLFLWSAYKNQLEVKTILLWLWEIDLSDFLKMLKLLKELGVLRLRLVEFMPRFLIKNKIVRLIANIVFIPLWWMFINQLLAQFFTESIDLTFSGLVESYEQFYARTGVLIFFLPAFYGSIMLVPLFWLTWYLWIRKQVPRIK